MLKSDELYGVLASKGMKLQTSAFIGKQISTGEGNLKDNHNYFNLKIILTPWSLSAPPPPGFLNNQRPYNMVFYEVKLSKIKEGVAY